MATSLGQGAAPRYRVTKRFDDLPYAHRTWSHPGRCRFLHGYACSFVLTFEADELEETTGFVIDLSALKDVRDVLQQQFDHTTVIAADDPELGLFQMLHDRGLLDLRVLPRAGLEGAAAWVLESIGPHIAHRTGGRVRLVSVEARESPKNAVVVDT